MMKKLLAAILLFVLSNVVFAEAKDPGFYIAVAGGSAGKATLDSHLAFVSDSTSGGVYLGYQFTPSFSVQGGYTSLFYGSTVRLNNADVGSTTISGTEFNVILSKPIGRSIFPFLLIGKSNMTETDTLNSGGVQPAISFAGPTFGAGVRFVLGTNYGAQLGYTYYSLKDYLGDALPLTNAYFALSYKY